MTRQSGAPWGIHWFRRDLRVQGNPALARNCKMHDGRVLGLFCFDPAFLSRPDFSPNRFAFFLETLHSLRAELRAAGGDLLTLDAGPARAFPALLARIRDARVPLPSIWSWNRDYEPFAVARDAETERLLGAGFGIEVRTDRDHLLIEPRELRKDEGGFYQIYTPFKKRWLKLLETEEMRDRVAFQSDAAREPLRFRLTWKRRLPPTGSDAGPVDALDSYRSIHLRKATVPLPPAGAAAALSALRAFGRTRLDDYAEARDYPAREGSSGLSIYLKNGSLTVAQIVSELGLDAAAAAGRGKFLSELIWREFHYHVLANVPRVENAPFHARYAGIRWENDTALFDAWRDGRTGFPIVDAAMRELQGTGLMHNRARMIVASFLTKDLHVDWRWGERHFMKELLDGDLAPNNGGWQWAASTGCDAQPYFRIFNPWLQGKRFDPDGEYVRRWVPELAGLTAREIHAPAREGRARARGYPAPVVDHARRSKRAVALYRAARA